MTMVSRDTGAVVGWQVGYHRTEAVMQAMLDEAPQAVWYDSDGLSTYSALFYAPGIHAALRDKSQTYRVEGMNAELRHDLARLARRSRCFSRCIEALARAVKLFVVAWNRRQLYKHKHPDYPAHLIHFLYLLN